MADPVKLLVRNTDDIDVVSSLLQDALCTPSDMQHDVAVGEFLAVVNRFCWEQPSIQNPQDGKPVYARTMAGLRIADVLSVQQRGMEDRSGFYNLLAIEYEKPKQSLRLVFSAGAEIRLHVSDLRLVLADLSVDYPTPAQPHHQ